MLNYDETDKIEFEIIKQRQTRMKCGFVSVFVLLEVTNSRIKCEIFSLCNHLGIFYGHYIFGFKTTRKSIKC